MTMGQDKKRYTLVLPQELFARLEAQAATEGRPEGAQFVMRHPDGRDERLVIL